jgi:hypothetical protein
MLPTLIAIGLVGNNATLAIGNVRLLKKYKKTGWQPPTGSFAAHLA